LATSHAELRQAAEKVASAIQAVGLDRWPRFLADAQDRARKPSTVAALERSKQPPDPSRDAIRPVYPVETMLGIAATGIAGGSMATVRAMGVAILKQMLPNRPSLPATTGEILMPGGQPVGGSIDTHVTEDKRVLLRFSDSAFKDPFFAQQMSDGTLKVFAYLLLLEDPDPPPFLCIEEPENGLYHKLLETLRRNSVSMPQAGKPLLRFS
jgi:putative AbiEii toxin of type IV toxin-antitoxin system